MGSNASHKLFISACTLLIGLSFSMRAPARASEGKDGGIADSDSPVADATDAEDCVLGTPEGCGANTSKENPPSPAAAGKADVPINGDAMLLELREHLRKLAEGQLEESVEIEGLFTIALDDEAVVERRAKSLDGEIAQLSLTLKQTENRRANIETEIPEPIPPEILSAPPSLPEIPTKPTPPEQPQSREPRGKKNEKRGAKWLARYEEWSGYREAMESYETNLKNYEEALETAETKTEKFQADKKAYDRAQTELNTAREKRLRDIAGLESQLRHEKNHVATRLEIARIRQRYLKQLATLLGTLPEPATAVLESLKKPRDSIREAGRLLDRVAEAINSLSTRLDTLANLAAAGSLVGFRVKRDRLHGDLTKSSAALGQRYLTLKEVADTIRNTAHSIDEDSRFIRRFFYLQVMNKQKTSSLDTLFAERLRKMRKGARTISYLAPSPADYQDNLALATSIHELLKEPDQIRSVVNGERILGHTKSLIETLDTTIDGARIERERFMQAHRRELVTLLTSVASDEAKNKAYSFSREIVADILADVDNLAKTLKRWGAEKLSSISTSPNLLKTREGVMLAVRLVFALIVLLVFFTLGHRIRQMITTVIRKFSTSSFFRHRVGALVKWAGLVEALMPAVLFAITAYLVLFLVGFENREIQFIAVAIRWAVIYTLGRNLLEGFTRPISRGRPALISVKPKITNLLKITYSRLGLVLVGTAVVHEWCSEWLGAGLLSAAILWFAWIWAGGWSIWAMFQWREPLGEALAGLSKDNLRTARFGTWMSSHPIGALFSPPASAWLLSHMFLKKIRSMLASGGILAYFRARSLKRLSKLNTDSTTPGFRVALPEKYTKQFPLYPIYADEEVVLLPREKQVVQVLEQHERWRVSKQDSSIVILGEKGIGKTTFLSLIDSRIEAENITRHSITKKIKTEAGFVREIGSALGIDSPGNIGEIAALLNNKAETVIFLDEAHNLFLRTVDGYDAYEALVRLVNFTSEHVFWVIVFNSFSWAFLNQSRRRVHYFRRLLKLTSWSQTELQELIAKRNKLSEFEVKFDEVLLDADRSMTGQFEVIDSAEGFFRLLWEASRGNPRIATHLWLHSLHPTGTDKMRVGLFSEASSEELRDMDRDVLFALAAICQHENLSVAELREVLNVSLDFAGFAVRYLLEYQLIEPKHTDPRRITLAPGFYTHVLKELRQNHLIFEEG